MAWTSRITCSAASQRALPGLCSASHTDWRRNTRSRQGSRTARTCCAGWPRPGRKAWTAKALRLVARVPARISLLHCASGRVTTTVRGSPIRIVYPFTDTTLISPDWDRGPLPGVDRAAGAFMVRVHAGEADASNPLVSILHADH